MGASVREKIKNSGVFWVFVYHQGQRRSRKIGDLKTARAVADKINAKITLGELDFEAEQTDGLTFREYSELWLEGYVREFLKPSTFERYTSILKKHVWPVLGIKPLSAISRKDVRQLLMGLSRKGLSPASIALVRDVISGPLGQALDDELIVSNPTTGIMKRLRIRRDKRSSQAPLDAKEVANFLDTCRRHYPAWYPFYLTAFRTGMRLGELLGLKWGDIDFFGKFIHVRRSFKLGRFSTPKNGKTRRVDMSDMLIAGLKALRTQAKKQALLAGGERADLLFHRDGIPIAQNSVRNTFKQILAKAELRQIRFHDIRHTFASLLLSQGESPAYVKDQLGHHSIKMTVDVYGHLIPGANRGAVNRLDLPCPQLHLFAPCENKEAATH
jgi:integrase